jgi:uncharacterized 2Fe-2S/4Fe-4S cluster protein (DUF4445 family)
MQIQTGFILPKTATDKKGFGIAVDIGTTTVAAYLFRLETGETLSVKSRLNAQAFLGLDVISRIKYCMDIEGGLAAMQTAIVKELNSFIASLTQEQGLSNMDVSHMVITGNTTMLHLLSGIDPRTMGYSPFKPASLFGSFIKATELQLDAPNTSVYLADCVSAFVGGDITCAILASGITETDAPCLLLDIGTNGEVALGSKNGLWTTSTAAGPAFEGAELKHGMAGVPGAIASVYLRDGRIEMTTIGGIAPKGICGSGVIDAMALFLDIGLVDETGRIEGKRTLPEGLKQMIIEEDGMAAIELSAGISITQKDIREVQKAKAAIAAGVLALLNHGGIGLADVGRVYLAGGFGNYMDATSALRIGLLPREMEGRIMPIGNAAGAGATLALLHDDHRKKLAEIKNAARSVELDADPYFMEQYIECMLFQTKEAGI